MDKLGPVIEEVAAVKHCVAVFFFNAYPSQHVGIKANCICLGTVESLQLT